MHRNRQQNLKRKNSRNKFIYEIQKLTEMSLFKALC